MYTRVIHRYTQDRRRDRHLDRAQRRRFVGVDGEGGNIDGRHEYLLLRAGTHVLETGKPLTAGECLDFLSRLPTHGIIYVSFFFDYDVTMILRDLPPERLHRLLDTDCRRIPGKPCSSYPIDWSDFQLDYIQGKEFRVRRRKEGAKWVIIHDTGSFFQTRFTNALTQWFGKETQYLPVIEKIEQGKNQRRDFGAVTEDERKYNLLEIGMLEQLMERFRNVCEELDIRPTRWQGPGNLVSAVFRREKLPQNKDIKLFDIHPDLIRMANMAYYGGNFTPCMFGEIPGPVHQWDINSAYAAVYRTLPCLLHGRWLKEDGQADDYLADIAFEHPSTLAFGALPIRLNNGTIVYPLKGQGIYWGREIEVAKKHGCKIKIQQKIRYKKQCDCQHFDFIYQLYTLRQQLGKNSMGRVLKLVLASIYGKLAQSIGCAPYSNPIWAGLITSTVRAQLADAALSVDHGHDVIMLATDGMFTRTMRTLDVGTEIGQWDHTIHSSMFTVQSGVYFLPPETAGKDATKSRGTPKTLIEKHEDEFRNIWSTFLETGILSTVKIPTHKFISIRLALARHKPWKAGQWEDDTKEISFDWTTKRALGKQHDTYYTTQPLTGSTTLRTQPYDRTIGGLRTAERLTLAEQPDWSSNF